MRSGRAGALAALLAAAGAAGTARAQEALPAKLLTFGIEAGAEIHSSAALAPGGEPASAIARTRLSLGYRDATPVEVFEVGVDMGLRARAGPGDRHEFAGLTGPAARLSYDRAVPGARLGLVAFAERVAIALTDPAEDLDPDDPLSFATDLRARRGEGTRLEFGVEGALELRRDAPFGASVSAGYRGRRYAGPSDPDLVDADRYALGLALRFEPDMATLARLGIESVRSVEATATGATTLSYDVERRFAAGSAGLRGTATLLDEGSRLGLTLRGARAHPALDLSARLGTNYDTGADALALVGGLRAERDLVTGSLVLDLDRRLSTGGDGAVLLTTLALDYGAQLTELTGLTAGIDYARADPSGPDPGGPATGRASIGVALEHDLTREWALAASLRHRVEDDGAGALAHDSVISLDLRRRVLIALP